MATWQQWTVYQNQASLFVTCCLLISRYWIRASHPQGVLESMVSMQQPGQIGENSLLQGTLVEYIWVCFSCSQQEEGEEIILGSFIQLGFGFEGLELP